MNKIGLIILMCLGVFLVFAGIRGWNIPATHIAWFSPGKCNKTFNNIMLIVGGILCILFAIGL